jgi:hypothetical protein
MMNKSKIQNAIYVILLATITIGCGGNRGNDRSGSESTILTSDSIVVEAVDACITVDVNKKYPHKELILQDIMDVEYIPLESTDKFLCQGVVQAVGQEIIIVRNTVNDGDIFIFDRKGKGLRRFNRKGQGPGEYMINISAFLDDTNGEIYVDNVVRNVIVYDLQGNYLKDILRSETKWINPTNYNSDYLIAKESPSVHRGKKINNQRFMLVSKQNNRVVKDFRIYFKDKVNWGITNRSGTAGRAPRLFPIVPLQDSWLLVETSSDTIFKLSPDLSLRPFIARTPSIQSMKTPKVLLPCVFTDRYYFMETITMELDHTLKGNFPNTRLVYDKKEGSTFEYTVYNNDFSKKVPVNFTMQETTNNEIVFCQKIESHELLEAYANGELKGELKEIAASLDEDSNPIIMLVKYKKNNIPLADH